jgi:2-polyprenyl-3-methyl-5-hydroxy-6-metoxy-1,4-benzoquinol methylase
MSHGSGYGSVVSPTPRISVDPQRQEDELKAYLGDDYSRDKLEHHQREIDNELAAAGHDEATFYRSAQAYLYDLTVFAMSGTKVPYLERFAELVPAGARVLDYGCGIGADGLALLDAGFKVEFADFDNPSTAFLKWRLAHRGYQAPVYDLDENNVPDGFAAAYSFDVIEHVKDPFAFLAELEKRAGLIMVNLLEFDPNEQELHYPLPMAEMLKYVADRDLVSYQLLHGSSHLVAYRPQKVSAAKARRNRLRMRMGQIGKKGDAHAHHHH